MNTDEVLGFRRPRKSDPVTSHAAAGEAEQFANAHCDRILACLDANGPMGKDGIAGVTGITGVAVARRLPELERDGLVTPTGNKRPSNTGRLEREWASASWLKKA